MEQTTIPCGICDQHIPDMDTWLDHMESHSELDVAQWQRDMEEDYLSDQEDCYNIFELKPCEESMEWLWADIVRSFYPICPEVL